MAPDAVRRQHRLQFGGGTQAGTSRAMQPCNCGSGACRAYTRLTEAGEWGASVYDKGCASMPGKKRRDWIGRQKKNRSVVCRVAEDLKTEEVDKKGGYSVAAPKGERRGGRSAGEDGWNGMAAGPAQQSRVFSPGMNEGGKGQGWVGGNCRCTEHLGGWVASGSVVCSRATFVASSRRAGARQDTAARAATHIKLGRRGRRNALRAHEGPGRGHLRACRAPQLLPWRAGGKGREPT